MSAKRFVDLLISVAGIALLAALYPFVAILIKLDSEGPVIFRTVRIGKDGHPFTMFKFRTMLADAEDRLKLLQHLNRGGDRLIRIPGDPRITRVGGFLRRTSIDELPQLVNVLRGEMSVVGPRPQAPQEVALYNVAERRRLLVLPGITGLWQVKGRESSDFAEWIRWDFEYIDHQSLGLDIQIMILTLMLALKPVVRRIPLAKSWPGHSLMLEEGKARLSDAQDV